MSLLDKLCNENKDIMIIGDFNINLINNNNDKNTSNFLDAMFCHSFLPFITTPTKITRNTKTPTQSFSQPCHTANNAVFPIVRKFPNLHTLCFPI